MKSRLNSIFYVYYEASLAVFLLFGALIELVCGYLINIPVISNIAYVASIAFLAIVISLIISIINQERKLS